MGSIGRGIVLSYVNILLGIISGIFLTPFMIQAMGKSEYGLYILIGSVVGYMSVFDFGINNALIRFVSKYRAEGDTISEQKFLGQGILVYLLLALLIVLVGYGFYLNIDAVFGQSLTIEELSKAKQMFVVLLINIAITVPGGAFDGVINAYERYEIPRISRSLRIVSRVILIYYVLKNDGDAISVVLIDTAINIIIVGLNAFYCFKVLKIKLIFSFDRIIFVTMFSYSFWVFLNTIIDQLYWKMGQTLLGIFENTAEVAVYAVAATIIAYYMTISGSLVGIFLPKATKMFVEKIAPNEITTFMVKVGRIQSFILIGVLVGFVFFGKKFIILWVGLDFMESYYIIIVTLIGLTPYLIQSIGGILLQAYGKFSIRTLILLTIVIFNLFLAIFLVKIYAGLGVAYSTAISFMIQFIVLSLYYKKTFGISLKQYYGGLIQGWEYGIFIIIGLGFICSVFNFTDELWSSFLWNSMLFLLFYLMSIYFIVLKSTEKSVLLKYLKSKMHKFL
ncbi:MAG: oligosaccharide flippase family protein [Flavobacteriaceae bacterium]|nr:oligosaccharide flippase family protein [Flavobacteriaceae bacterium]